MTNTIALFSSARRNGNTLHLLHELEQLWDIDIAYLDDYRIHDFDYLHRNNQDQFQSLVDRILQYDNIIFACPVYWSSVTPQLKAFFDRLTDLLDIESYKHKGRQLRGKNAYLVCTSNQKQAAKAFTSMFKDIFKYLGIHYQGELHADCSQGFIADKYRPQLEAFCRQPKISWRQQLLQTLANMGRFR